MNLSEKQLKILQRIHKKHPVSIEFLKYNLHNIIKEINYFTKLHFIIKCKLIQRNNRVFMHYNVPHKRILSKSYIKKQYKRKNYKSTIKLWSKNIVMYNKKLHLLDKIKEQTNEISNSDSQNDMELNLTPDEIQKQLKTQLELLKGGKRFQPSASSTILSSSSTPIGTPKLFTSNSDITKRLSLDRISSFGGGGGGSSCSSFDISLKDAKEAGPSNIKRIRHDDLYDTSSSSVDQFSDFINHSKFPTVDKNSTIDLISNNNENIKCLDAIEPIKKQQKSFNFIDSLINKINSTIDKNPDENITNESENIDKNEQLSGKNINLEHTEEDSLSSGEFLGFPDVEIIQPNIPGMLPTPVVPRKFGCTQSAFVSEDLDKFMRDNLLDKNINNTNIIDKIPKSKRFEDGLVCKGAIPPTLKMAALPTELGKPRTVAEKRIMLQKNKNIKYLMIENENTIYHELKKRSRDCNANIPLIKSLQKQSIPATRDFWKATSWLVTQNGKFYFQIANIDGIECKLIGGYGNNINKNLPYQFSYPIKKDIKRLKCTKNCKDLNIYKNIKIRFDSNKENHKIHLVPNVKDDINNYKPGPLSTKCMQLSYVPNYGPTEIYRMPKIQLEVFPKINRPLDDICKSYLKMILPSKNITKEWAEFAVSTLISPKSSSSLDNLKESTIYKSYTFNIPYLNEENNILVRRIYNRKEKFDKITTDDLKFRKIANKSNDPITLECANILSEMIDSVAIGLSEDSLIKNDPDIDYKIKIEENTNLKKAENTITPNIDVNTEKKPDKKSNKKSVNPKSRLMSELKRLNATIIDAGGSAYDEEVKEQCTKPHCRLGCVCMSLNSQTSLKKHCKKPECMIECNCITGLVETENINSGITSQDALMIRQKATARLARMEREFSSTVVLTNTETLLINESQYERKRRCTKRYLNYTYDSENDINNGKDDTSSQPPNKRLRNSNQKVKGPVTEAKLPPLDDIVYVNEDVMKKLKHCQVDLCKLQYFDNIEKWCMIHCLYKCFCKTKDLTGKPFILKKDELSEKDDIIYSRKPKYSFDKNEETTIPTIKSPSLQNVNDGKKIVEKIKLPIKITSPNKLKSNSNVKIDKPVVVKRNEELLRENLSFESYYRIRDQSCRRTLQIPPTYGTRNKRYVSLKRRSTKYRYFVENDKTRLLLSERIRYSENYKPVRLKITSNLTKFNLKTPMSHSISKVNKINSNLHEVNKSNCNLTNDNDKESPQFLKISSVVSLNSSPKTTITQNTSEILSTISAKTDLLQTPPNFDTQDIHKNVLKLLNSLVTRTMHNICKIQVDESKNIPNPVAETLHISQWRYFLQAFIEGLIHIWEVKVDNKIYFTGTMQNIMPFIRNAISVVNIKAIRKENLPLFGKMLNAKVINQQTNSLSILMAGHNDYWRILGMTKSSIDYLTQGGVIKPTPQSHPWLAKKINTLYEIMAKNRIDKIIANQCNNANNDNNININSNGNNNNTDTNDNINNINSNNNNKTIDINLNNNNNNDYDEIIKKCPLNVNKKMDRFTKMNIQIRQLTQREIIQDKFTIPISSCSPTSDYRWLVLDIVDDFSHILFAETMECLSHNKIKIAFQRSYHENKMVRLAKVGGDKIDCYVMKNDKDRVYLGPFDLNGHPEIVLYQNIDGKMMLREDFEKLQNIKRTASTSGFWLCRKNGKIIFDIDTKERSLLLNSKSDTNGQISILEKNENANQQKQNLSTCDEPIIIDHDSDGNSNECSINISNLTTNFEIYNVQTLNKDNNILKIIEKTDSNDNIKLTTTTPTSSYNSQKLQPMTTSTNLTSSYNSQKVQPITTTLTSSFNSEKVQPIAINNKILNNNFIGIPQLCNTNTTMSNCTISSTKIVSQNNSKLNLLNTEINSNSTKETGLITLNPGIYEIKCTEKSNQITKIITTGNCNLRTPNKTAVDKQLCKPNDIPKTIINDENHKKSLFINNLIEKFDVCSKVRANLNNQMVAKKSTTSAARNPNTVVYKDIYIPTLSNSKKQSNIKLLNNLLSDASTLVKKSAHINSTVFSLVHKSEINQSKLKKVHKRNSLENYQSKQNKSFDINSTEITPTDKATSPEKSNNNLLTKVPSFINISPITSTSPLIKSNISSTKTTSTFTSNTLTTSSISNSQASSNVKEISRKSTDVKSNNFGVSEKKIENCTKNTSIPKPVANISTANDIKNINLSNKNDNLTNKNDNSSKNNNSRKNDNSRPRTIAGYFISNIRDYPRYGGMRREPNYLIKSSSNSAVQLTNLYEVGKFLNNHVRKHCAAFKAQYKNVSWNFVPYKKLKCSPQKEKKSMDAITVLTDVKSSSKSTINFDNRTETVKNNRENNITDVKQSTIVSDVIVIDDED